jgi:hypothetical protein
MSEISSMSGTRAAIERELFGQFNAHGSLAFVREFEGEDDFSGDDGMMIDSWRVLRVRRKRGGGTDFWVAWRDLGFDVDPGQQYVHLRKITAFEWCPNGMLLLRSSYGEVIFVRSLEDRKHIRRFAEAQTRHAGEGEAWRKRDAEHVVHLARYAAQWHE